MNAQQIKDEVKYLLELTQHPDLDWAQVSGPCLRYLLACVRMQGVLEDREALAERLYRPGTPIDRVAH